MSGELPRPSYPGIPSSWPEWAVTEDGELVWIRADLDDQAERLASPALDGTDCQLVRVGRRAMWLDLVNTEWSWDWLLRHVDDDADEAVAYVEYEVAYVQ